MIVGLMGEAVVMAKLFLLLAARLILSRDNRRQFIGKRALTTIIPSLLLLALQGPSSEAILESAFHCRWTLSLGVVARIENSL